MNRRNLVLDGTLAVACAGILPCLGVPFVTASTAPVSAQNAPGTALADPGIPALDISVTATSIDGVPESLESGRYLLTVTAAADLEFGGGVEFAQPIGVEVDEFLEAVMAPGDGMPPPWLWEPLYAGGVFAQSGQTVRGIVDLPPGEWVVHGGGGNPQQPFTIEVTGALPSDLAGPKSSATLTMGEYVIEVTEGALQAGSQWLRIDNVGAQPHFVIADLSAKPVTMDDVAALLDAELTGTPAAVGIDPDTDLKQAFMTGVQSTNTSLWVEVDLTAGTYVLLCFWPDMADGMPHAMHGMYQVITISS